MSLDPGAWTAVDNDDGSAWCDAPVGSGTPGDPNDACPAPVCGDGVLDPGEACDDGGILPGDGCDDMCLPEGCPVLEHPTGAWEIAALPGFMNSAAVLTDGSVALGGQTSSSSQAGAWVSAVAADGSAPTWTHGLTYSVVGMPLKALAAAADGGVFVVGELRTSPDKINVTLVNADGTTAWRRHASSATGLGVTLYARPLDASRTADGGVVVVGKANNTSPSPDEEWGQIVKFNSAGGVEWEHVWEDLTTDRATATAVAQLPDGGYLVGGNPELTRFDAAGDRLWSTGAPGDLLVDDIVVTADGEALIAGRYQPSGSTSQPILMKVTPDGDVTWSRTVVQPADIYPLFVAATPARCDVAPAPGAACPTTGDACATATEVCTCDGVWSCAPGEQTYILSWKDAYGRVTSFDEAGVAGPTRAIDPIYKVEAMAADGRGVAIVGHGPSGARVLRMTASLEGACGLMDVTGPVISTYVPVLSSDGYWGYTSGPVSGSGITTDDVYPPRGTCPWS